MLSGAAVATTLNSDSQKLSFNEIWEAEFPDHVAIKTEDVAMAAAAAAPATAAGEAGSSSSRSSSGRRRARKRKRSAADGEQPEQTQMKKKIRRVKRMTTSTVLKTEVTRMQQQETEEQTSTPVDGIGLEREIREAGERASVLLTRLDALLDVGMGAVTATAKYAQLLAQLRAHRAESDVVERVCEVFNKLLATTASARDSCARLPAEFGRMLLRHEAFMRASTSALVPRGISVFAGASATDAKSGRRQQLLLTDGREGGPPAALVQFGGPQSKATYRLVCEQPTRAQASELRNSYLATSMMNANYDPRITTTAMNAARRDEQRRVARTIVGNEVVPQLFGAEQARLMAGRLDAAAAAAAAVTAPVTGRTPMLAAAPSLAAIE